ncbi:proton-coupled folate transporter-like [Orbicella faveolata]|uniref:proton-coupled folate transporter-like n=1 Tax=Orbicella faveolata TaxID=48498 RepID=UPI0009E4C38A|nr:proton-coupled folate transporter-like [Orbicella faveolata]
MPRKISPGWRRYLTVEPVILLYTFGLMTSMPIWDQYVYSTLSEKRGFPYDELVVEKEGLGCNFTELNSTLKDLEQQVQSLATKIDLGNTFFMAIPSLIVAPFWGPWTDKSGRRKPALMAPAIGTLLQTILVLMIMYFEWPLYVLFVGSAISGFSGFLTTLMLASMSYIADTTEKTGVAFRIAIIQMLVFMGGVLSQLTSGLWIHTFGFIAPTWLILACHVASALWVIFLVPENPVRAINVKNKFFDCRSLKTLVDVFRKKREGGRKSLLLLVFTGAIITLTTQGLGGVTALFVMRSPLCFSPKLVGYFLAYRMFIAGLGGAIGVKLLRKFFSEMVTSGISMVCQMGEMVLLAFATLSWLVFLAPMLGFFKTTVTPVFAGIMSRIVGADEQGSLFCAYGIFSVISQFLGAMLFNNVYLRTLGHTFNGFVFLLCAAVKIIPLCLLWCIDVPPVVDRFDEKGGALEDKKEDANKKEEEVRGENNREEVKNGEDKPTVCPEHIELVKTTEQSRSQNA